MSPRALSVLIAPDSFKGSFSAVEVAEALAAGWRRARPWDAIELAPLADGGEGTIHAIAAGGGWDWQATEVADPLGRPVRARWLLSLDGRIAVLEMAEASGLWRVASGERDPVAATSLGTGQLIAAAAATGVERVVLGIGGSATTDGGRGLIAALGATWAEGPGAAGGGSEPGAAGGGSEPGAAGAGSEPGAAGPGPAEGPGAAGPGPVDLSGVPAVLGSVRLEVACDVSNPLLGPRGAAAIYGPQKGATPELVAALDASLAVWADRLEAAAGRRVRDTPGAGAAGGVGFALLALQDRFASFGLRPGVDLVMEATGFAAKLGAANLVITGEGRIDESTAFGKTALGVARRAQAAGVPCVAVGGGVTAEGVDALRPLGVVVMPVIQAPMSVDAAIALGTGPIEAAAERIAALVSMGLTIGEQDVRS